jgi:hypothetical protein
MLDRDKQAIEEGKGKYSKGYRVHGRKELEIWEKEQRTGKKPRIEEEYKDKQRICRRGMERRAQRKREQDAPIQANPLKIWEFSGDSSVISSIPYLCGNRSELSGKKRGFE